jgi:anti-sigma B factor antagonist
MAMTVQLLMSTRIERGVTVVAPSGEVDMASAPQLREKLGELLNDGITNLLVDMSEVAFLDSSGLGVLVSAMKQTRASGGSIRLAGVRPLVLKVLEITRLTDALPTYRTVDEALDDAT